MKQKLKIILFLFISLPCNANLSTDFFHAYNLNKEGKIKEASELYRSIVKANPWCTQALYNFAHTLKDLGDIPQAIEAYKKVISEEPDNNFARLGLAQCYLSQGNLSQGFELFEFRASDIALFKSHISYLKNQIKNKISLHGIKILLRSEWGLGDCIQFIRFAKQLKDLGATIIVQAYPAVHKLFNLCPYIDTVISVGDAFPDHQAQIPLLSLPYILESNLNQINISNPYIYADPTLSELWKKKLMHDTNLKIGICWCGNGDKNAPPLLNKNILLEQLKPLFDLKNVSIYALQRSETQEQNIESFNLILFDEHFDQRNGRFMDTAAIMNSLDLIITIDTSIAHLAGAMQRPVWVMLPYHADWRWMEKRNDSPWYASMKLFRQPEPGDWQAVVKEMCNRIQNLIGEAKI